MFDNNKLGEIRPNQLITTFNLKYSISNKARVGFNHIFDFPFVNFISTY